MNQATAALPGEQSIAGKIESIQSLRAIAAFAVIFHHVGLVLESYYTEPLSTPLKLLSGMCASGVDLFFVISGYIIYRSTSRLSPGFSSAREFIQKRALRVYPTYWVWTSVLLLLWVGGLALKSHEYSPSVIIGSYLLVPVSRADGSLHPVLDQGWTLAFEMYFYLVFAGLILLNLRRKGPAWISLPFLTIAAVGLLPAVPVNVRSVISSPLILEFLLGICIGWCLNRWPSAPRPVSAVRFGLAAIGASILTVAFLQGEIEGTGADRLVLYGVPSASIVMLALLSRPVRAFRYFARLGDASYSIYLTHGFFTLALGTLLKRGMDLHGAPADLILLLASTAILVISSTTYWLVEKPLAKLLARPANTPQPIGRSQSS